MENWRNSKMTKGKYEDKRLIFWKDLCDCKRKHWVLGFFFDGAWRTRSMLNTWWGMKRPAITQLIKQNKVDMQSMQTNGERRATACINKMTRTVRTSFWNLQEVFQDFWTSVVLWRVYSMKKRKIKYTQIKKHHKNTHSDKIWRQVSEQQLHLLYFILN